MNELLEYKGEALHPSAGRREWWTAQGIPRILAESVSPTAIV
jgi:hypothetical protein